MPIAARRQTTVTPIERTAIGARNSTHSTLNADLSTKAGNPRAADIPIYDGRIGGALRRSASGSSAGQNTTDARSHLNRVPERLLLVTTVLMGFCLPRLLPESDASAGSPISQCSWVLVYLIALAGILAEWRTALRLARASLPVGLIIVTAICSTLWSEAPLVSAKESLALLGTSLIALFFVCRLSLEAFIETFVFALTIAAFISAILIAFFPDLGRMHDDPNRLWQGAFVHKNLLGSSMVLGLASLACVNRAKGLRQAGLAVVGVLFIVLLIGSGSTTSIVIAAILALLFPVLLWSRTSTSGKPVIFTALVLVLATIAAAASGVTSEQAFGVLGKDTTLTGRTELWQFAMDAATEQPIFGYGYDAFFNPNTSSGQNAARFFAWDVNMAHNGFLEVMLGLGTLGLVSVVATLFTGFKRSLRYYRRSRDLAGVWPLLIVIYTVLGNLTEAGIARVNNVSWIVFLAAFLFATRACSSSSQSSLQSSLRPPG